MASTPRFVKHNVTVHRKIVHNNMETHYLARSLACQAAVTDTSLRRLHIKLVSAIVESSIRGNRIQFPLLATQHAMLASSFWRLRQRAFSAALRQRQAGTLGHWTRISNIHLSRRNLSMLSTLNAQNSPRNTTRRTQLPDNTAVWLVEIEFCPFLLAKNRDWTNQIIALVISLCCSIFRALLCHRGHLRGVNI